MDATKRQSRNSRRHDAATRRLLRTAPRELTPGEIDELERELQTLDVIDDVLRHIAPEMAMTEDY